MGVLPTTLLPLRPGDAIMTDAKLTTYRPTDDRLDATREKLLTVAGRMKQTLEDMAAVGEDFARYKAEHRSVYGNRPERGQGFDVWVESTFGVSYKTVARWITLHENRHLIAEATSLRGALAMLKGATPTAAGEESGHESEEIATSTEPAAPATTAEVFVDIITPEGIITAKRQSLRREAERKEVETLVSSLGVSEVQAWAYVASKRKPLRPVKAHTLPSGWKRVSIPLTREHSDSIAEAVTKAAKATRRRPHTLYEECVVELGLEAFRKKYKV